MISTQMCNLTGEPWVLFMVHKVSIIVKLWQDQIKITVSFVKGWKQPSQSTRCIFQYAKSIQI